MIQRMLYALQDVNVSQLLNITLTLALNFCNVSTYYNELLLMLSYREGIVHDYEQRYFIGACLLVVNL